MNNDALSWFSWSDSDGSYLSAYTEAGHYVLSKADEGGFVLGFYAHNREDVEREGMLGDVNAQLWSGDFATEAEAKAEAHATRR